MLVLIAVCLPLCIIMAAFAVDVAWMQLVRTELRSATDAAARAGAKELSLSQDANAARARAKEAARRNEVAGEPLLLADGDIEIGNGTQVPGERFRFTPSDTRPNAQRRLRSAPSNTEPLGRARNCCAGVSRRTR